MIVKLQEIVKKQGPDMHICHSQDCTVLISINTNQSEKNMQFILLAKSIYNSSRCATHINYNAGVSDIIVSM